MNEEIGASSYEDEYPDAIADVSKAREMAEAGDETETMAVEALKKANRFRHEAEKFEQQSEATQNHANRLHRWGDKKEAEIQERYAFHDHNWAESNKRWAEQEEKKAEEHQHLANQLEDAVGKRYDERKNTEERRLSAERDLLPEYMQPENIEKYKQAREEMDPEVMQRINRIGNDLITLIGSNSEVFLDVMDIINNKILHGDYEKAYIQEHTGFIKGIKGE